MSEFRGIPECARKQRIPQYYAPGVQPPKIVERIERVRKELYRLGRKEGLTATNAKTAAINTRIPVQT